MDMSDPRVVAVLAHAEACREAYVGSKSIPPLPHKLQDLSGIDLTRANLTHADLSSVNLGYAKLEGAKLISADLTGADLTSANLNGADLRGADLSLADLNGADLTSADLRLAKLNGADLTSANLEGVELRHTPTIGFADLTDAKVTQDQLNRARYRDVAEDGYPKEVAEKVILLHVPEANYWERKTKKRLVVELRADGKLHIKTPIFKY